MRASLAVAGLACFALILGLAAALPPDAPTVVAPPPPAPRPTFTAPPLVASGLPEAGVRRGSRAPAQVAPLRVPIAGFAVPAEAELLPEAARDYRAGIHEGIDFPADAGTPVIASGDGAVVRADRDFVDWSAEERAAALADAIALGRTPERTLDLIRGRQVWIDHGRGIVTRYAHLESVTVVAGQHVRAGEVIGAVGSSGYPEGGPHLHFEIRTGDSYLGDGLTPAELARALRETFR
ncbi:MAG TPA: M23 family metallopeptidase [Candidatus Limnocylindria bacterium]|nr:M23 family metallopeptidase [Candidatus Limnocylindria bacterium]